MPGQLLSPTSPRTDERPSLRHEPALSHGDPGTGNLVIHGDNLAALAALRPQHRGQVRCVYLDPPYNNGEQYTHYDDQADHETWLREVADRLRLLRDFLTEDGSVWISIDDSEVHYLKVAADGVFGRESFITTVVWQQRTTRENRKTFSNNHEYLLVYARNPAEFRRRRNTLPLNEEVRRRYANPDHDPRGPWQSVSANVQAGHATPAQFYEIVAPGGRRHRPPKGRCWMYSRERMELAVQRGEVWFGRSGNGVPRLKRYLADVRTGLTPDTLWLAADVGTNSAAKKHLLELFPDEPLFDTPKPESLLQRILQIATDPGDFVLDAYLGSGTTAAVAHKMGRRYLGIELGEHAVTHCAERLRKVIAGEGGGISDAVGWRGGGGFDFYSVRAGAPAATGPRKHLAGPLAVGAPG